MTTFSATETLPQPSRTVSSAMLVYLLIFLSPFSIYNVELGVVGLTPINMYTFLLFPFFLVICLLRNRFPNITGLGVLYLLYIFVATLSAVFALDKDEAFRAPIVYLFKFFLCFLYTIYFLRTREHVETAVKVFIFMGIVQALMGWTQLTAFFFFNKMIYAPFVELMRSNLSQKSFGYGFGALGIPGYTKMFGFSHEGGNFFGPYMAIPFSLSVYAAIMYKKIPLKLLALFLGLTIFVSASRSGYATTIISMSFLFFFIRRGRNSFYPLVMRAYAITVPWLAFLLLSLLLFKTNFFGIRTVIEVSDHLKVSTPLHILERANPFSTKDFSGSVAYFSSHLTLALKHGFDNFGFGLGGSNFDPFVFQVYPIKFGSHSNFIIFLGDTGYWGLLVQILIVFLTIRYGLITYFHSADGKKDHLVITLTAIFAGLVVAGILRTHYQDTYSFIVSGLIVKLYLLNKRKILSERTGLMPSPSLPWPQGKTV